MSESKEDANKALRHIREADLDLLKWFNGGYKPVLPSISWATGTNRRIVTRVGSRCIEDAICGKLNVKYHFFLLRCLLHGPDYRMFFGDDGNGSDTFKWLHYLKKDAMAFTVDHIDMDGINDHPGNWRVIRFFVNTHFRKRKGKLSEHATGVTLATSSAQGKDKYQFTKPFGEIVRKIVDEAKDIPEEYDTMERRAEWEELCKWYKNKKNIMFPSKGEPKIQKKSKAVKLLQQIGQLATDAVYRLVTGPEGENAFVQWKFEQKTPTGYYAVKSNCYSEVRAYYE